MHPFGTVGNFFLSFWFFLLEGTMTPVFIWISCYSGTAIRHSLEPLWPGVGLIQRGLPWDWCFITIRGWLIYDAAYIRKGRMPEKEWDTFNRKWRWPEKNCLSRQHKLIITLWIWLKSFNCLYLMFFFWRLACLIVGCLDLLDSIQLNDF